ncbi:MAG: glycosyltransferase family 4 protein, partial [Candidatus Eisenbacteria bacterium]
MRVATDWRCEPAGRLTIWIVSQSYLPYYGGITEHVWHLAEHLARRGHRVHLLTGRPLSRDLHPSDPDPPGVQVTRIGCTMRLPSHGAQACVTFGCRWTPRLARLEPPAVVHLQSPLEPFLPLWALERIDGVKIGTFHTGGEASHWGYRRFGPWLRRSASRLRERLAVSAEAARFVADHVPGRYRIVPNGVDLSRFARPASAGPPHGQGNPGRAAARILYVGRFDARKGLEVLLDAFQALSCEAAPSRRPHLILVG